MPFSMQIKHISFFSFFEKSFSFTSCFLDRLDKLYPPQNLGSWSCHRFYHVWSLPQNHQNQCMLFLDNKSGVFANLRNYQKYDSMILSSNICLKMNFSSHVTRIHAKIRYFHLLPWFLWDQQLKFH